PAPTDEEPAAVEAAAAEPVAAAEAPALGAGSLAIPTEVPAEYANLSGSKRLERANDLIRTANHLRNDGKCEEAITPYHEAVRHAPSLGRAYAGITMCYLTLENAPEAVRWAEAFVRARPEQAGNFVLLAKAHQLAGDEAAKKAALDQAIAVDPRHSEARAMLGLAPLAAPRFESSRRRR